jgi:hypothetical protein
LKPYVSFGQRAKDEVAKRPAKRAVLSIFAKSAAIPAKTSQINANPP